jgi:hypothetical protein
MRTCLVVLVFVVTLGCSSSGTWRRVDTPHFVLRTDLGSADAREAGVAIEATRDALVSAAWPKFPFKAGPKTEVYILANGVDFERYFGRRTAGIFFHSSPPMVFLYGSASRWELRRSSHDPVNSVLRHEMTHQLAAEVFARQPKWFAEGLADFLEVAYYSDDGRSIVLGGVNTEAYLSYKRVRRVTLRDALDWERGVASLSDTDAEGLYGTSWFFVHWLYNTHPEQLGRFEDELGRGTEPRLAFERAFSKFDADAVDRELFEYQRHGKFDVIEQPLVETKLSPESLQEELLNADDVDSVRATLAEASKKYLGKGNAKIAAAVPVRAGPWSAR